jgi:hypothetical protein
LEPIPKPTDRGVAEQGDVIGFVRGGRRVRRSGDGLREILAGWRLPARTAMVCASVRPVSGGLDPVGVQGARR